MRPVTVWVLAALSAGAAFVGASDAPAVLQFRSFGAVGDGVTDDGPALARAMKAVKAHTRPVTLRCDAKRIYRIETAPQTWVMDLDGARDVTIDGQGSEFVLKPHLRMLHARRASRIHVRRLKLDFDPLPFADGVVIEKNASARWVDVRIQQ